MYVTYCVSIYLSGSLIYEWWNCITFDYRWEWLLGKHVSHWKRIHSGQYFITMMVPSSVLSSMCLRHCLSLIYLQNKILLLSTILSKLFQLKGNTQYKHSQQVTETIILIVKLEIWVVFIAATSNTTMDLQIEFQDYKQNTKWIMFLYRGCYICLFLHFSSSLV